jgi:uncharacterized protein involved in type VI secretion and phage assembly
MPRPNEGTTYTVLVSADGRPLPDDVAALLASACVDTAVNVPDMLELRFSDDAGVVLGKRLFEVGTEVTVKVQPADNTTPDELMRGEVTAIETELDAAGMHVVVRAFDRSHRLYRGRRVKAFQNSTVSDVFRKVVSGAGLSAKCSVADTAVLEHVGQNAISDWEFITRLAGWIGAEVTMDKGTIELRDPVKASTAPSSSQSSQHNALVLERGRNIITLRATVTGADQVPSVEVRGWDVKRKEVVSATATAAASSAELAGESPAALAGKVHSPEWLEYDERFSSQSRCKARAGAVSGRLAGSFAEFDCLVEGNPDLRSGTSVALANVGHPFDGKYTVSAARHEFSPHTGYRTHVTVSNAADRSLYGLGTGGAAGSRAAGHMDGVTIGIVTSLKDPEQLGRVKLKFPMLADDFESGWCRVVQPGVGPRHGMVWLPEVGDEVLVAFGQGHSDAPYVLGGIFNGKDKPDKAWDQHVDGQGRLTRRALVSRTGMVVEMLESAQAEQLVISTTSGKHKISLSQKDNTMELASEGPVSVTAKQDITLSTESGTVSIKGNNVKIEATSDLTLNGTNVSAQAKAQLQVKGAETKVAGDASAELSGAMTKVSAESLMQLSSSGIAELQGSLVKIN